MSSNDEFKAYLVGGALRDELLTLPVKDRDWVVVGSTPETMQELGYRPVGKHFPVFLHPDNQEEYALARTERKVSAGHGGFEFNTSTSVTLEQDLSRRDLTINAIARDNDGTLIDPYGGIQDIDARILRHVSDAFAEDPLRVLRVARFAARFAPLGFSIAPETLSLMTDMAGSGELNTLSAERIWAEIHTALTFSDPQPFFDALRSCGALAALLPELDQLYGIEQKAEYHPEIDVGIHNEMVLKQICAVSNEPDAKFAALCHDIGKGKTPVDILPAHHGHEERGATMTEVLCERLRVPKDFRSLAIMTARYHTHCHRAMDIKATTLAKFLLSLDSLRRPERFETFLQVCEADARGRKGLEQRNYPQADFLRGALKQLQELNDGELAKHAIANNLDVAIEIYQHRVSALKRYIAAAKG